jgi:hypothetical protein
MKPTCRASMEGSNSLHRGSTRAGVSRSCFILETWVGVSLKFAPTVQTLMYNQAGLGRAPKREET